MREIWMLDRGWARWRWACEGDFVAEKPPFLQMDLPFYRGGLDFKAFSRPASWFLALHSIPGSGRNQISTMGALVTCENGDEWDTVSYDTKIVSYGTVTCSHQSLTFVHGRTAMGVPYGISWPSLTLVLALWLCFGPFSASFRWFEDVLVIQIGVSTIIEVNGYWHWAELFQWWAGLSPCFSWKDSSMMNDTIKKEGVGTVP